MQRVIQLGIEGATRAIRGSAAGSVIALPATLGAMEPGLKCSGKQKEICVIVEGSQRRSPRCAMASFPALLSIVIIQERRSGYSRMGCTEPLSNRRSHGDRSACGHCGTAVVDGGWHRSEHAPARVNAED